MEVVFVEGQGLDTEEAALRDEEEIVYSSHLNALMLCK